MTVTLSRVLALSATSMQRSAASAGVARLAEDLLDDVGADEVGQPVGAQQEAVADLGLAQRRVGLVVGLAGHDAGDDRALRVVAGLLLGDAALVDELLHEGVVLGDLAEACRRAA